MIATIGTFVVGCFIVPSLDAGSHGMAVPILFGFRAFVYSLPVGLIVALVWLIVRISRDAEEQESICRAIDQHERDTLKKEPNQPPEPMQPKRHGSS